MPSSAEIRRQFIEFFVQKHAHRFVPSSPVVPLDDPTLLFTNAGMNQFKPIFLGQEKREYSRAVNSQKCIRAGGKHNDLDDVGRSRRHHTFFEMLGNWSFGDYFKRGAIEMAWELLTTVWKLDPSRLHVSCYEGNPAAGIPRDDEAANLWKEIAHLPDDHIHYFGKDNFWEMGDTGPCGPCTEIYVDRTPEKNGGKSVNGDDPRVMEIWNLVFIQYNRDARGKLTPLPAQHVDTGMGLERLCQVIQGKDDNYGTDLWEPVFKKISEISGLKYTGKFPKSNVADPAAEAADAQLRYDIAFRVVADHIRCLTFALTDGAVPSNEGRGYVLRRILRRAVFWGWQHLKIKEPFMHRLVPVVVESMGEAFPELKRDPNKVIELIKDEEISFGKTLDRGIELFEQATKVKSIAAADAFKLHDTYGFPIDLTRIMAEERGMTVDVAGYEKLMDQARELARAGGKVENKTLAEIPPEQLPHLKSQFTDDKSKFSSEPISAKVVAIWDGYQFWSDLHRAEPDTAQDFAIILDRTNFYAEMGGQVGDQGHLAAPGTSFTVSATKVVGGFVLHIGHLTSGAIQVGTHLTATVDPVLRPRTQANHTATHLANWALREVLGEGVQQKGSLVDPEKLRFDFSYGKSMEDAQIERVENLVRERIAEKLAVNATEAPQTEALKISGLRAVFGEKYPEMVRVVSIGPAVDELLQDSGNARWRNYSVEFCGGTHVKNSSEIAHFAVTAEESVSKGIRRIVALTGEKAAELAKVDAEVASLIKTSEQEIEGNLPGLIGSLQKISGGQISLRSKRLAQHAIAQLQARNKAHEKSVAKSQGAAQISIDTAALIASAVNGKLIVSEIAGAGPDQLRGAIDSLRSKMPSHAIMLAGVDGETITFVAAVSDDLVAKGLKAGDWVKKTAAITSGGGGGRPQMAQGSGKDATKIGAALEEARKVAGIN